MFGFRPQSTGHSSPEERFVATETHDVPNLSADRGVIITKLSNSRPGAAVAIPKAVVTSLLAERSKISLVCLIIRTV